MGMGKAYIITKPELVNNFKKSYGAKESGVGEIACILPFSFCIFPQLRFTVFLIHGGLASSCKCMYIA
jgi:hypothetical protein